MPSSTYDRRPTVIGGRYLRFFVAAILASLLLQVTIVTDTVIVGRLLGQVPMTGIRVTSPIITCSASSPRSSASAARP